MRDWVVILSFTYPHEAYLAKGKLESEGIETQVKDEMTVQVHNFYSNAIGGVKLLVRESDFQKARQILIEFGYIKPDEQIENGFFRGIDKATCKFPLIGKLSLEIRLIAFIMLTLILIAIPVAFLSIPSKQERLTENSWCVEKIYFMGQELIPNTMGLKMISEYDNCSETMTFYKNGMVTFPGIDSYGDRCRWKLEKDSLIITVWNIDHNYEFGDNLEIIEKKEHGEKSIFHGVYILEIENSRIKMQSDSLTIIGRIYKFIF